MAVCPSRGQENPDTAPSGVEQGRGAEADVELQASLAVWREVGAKRYEQEGEALLAVSA
jgi:hypothetical protein